MENEFNGFVNNFDTVVSIDSNNDIDHNADESPSSVKTDEVKTESVENQSVNVAEITTNDEQSEVINHVSDVSDEPKMVPYNETALLKELSNSIKEESGIEINSTSELKSFITELKENIIEKEFSNEDSLVYKRAKELILEEKGIDENVLAIATGIPYGIDREEYMEYVSVKEFADQQIDPKDTESLKVLYATFHSIKGISEEEIETYVEYDLDRGDEFLIEKRKEFLRDYAESGLASIDQKIKHMHNSKVTFEAERKKQINESISTLLKEGTFTKEEIDSYIEATTKKTEEITLPDNTKKSVTLFEKKKYEFSQKNLKEAIVENIKFFLDKKEDKEIVNDKQKNKQTGEFMKNYLKDINSKADIIVEKEISDGFSVVKSNI